MRRGSVDDPVATTVDNEIVSLAYTLGDLNGQCQVELVHVHGSGEAEWGSGAYEHPGIDALDQASAGETPVDEATEAGNEHRCDRRYGDARPEGRKRPRGRRRSHQLHRQQADLRDDDRDDHGHQKIPGLERRMISDSRLVPIRHEIHLNHSPRWCWGPGPRGRGSLLVPKFNYSFFFCCLKIIRFRGQLLIV